MKNGSPSLSKWTLLLSLSSINPSKSSFDCMY